jgi:hypothetical protein
MQANGVAVLPSLVSELVPSKKKASESMCCRRVTSSLEHQGGCTSVIVFSFFSKPKQRLKSIGSPGGMLVQYCL